jgi:hypothetical protein
MGSDENNEHASIDVEILAHVRSHMFGRQNVYTVEAQDINVLGTTINEQPIAYTIWMQLQHKCIECMAHQPIAE